MKIKMTETRRGCENGFTVRQYHKDCIYDLANTLAASFINKGWAKIVGSDNVYGA